MSRAKLIAIAFVVGVGAASSLTWLATTGNTAGGAERIPDDEIVQQTVVINPGLADGSERTELAPPADDEVDEALTAEDALAAFKSLDPQYTAADNSTAQLGSYTAASSADSFRFKDRLAWGFSNLTGCPPSPDPFESSSPGQCMDWLFLDARTGQMLEEVFHQVTSSSAASTTSQ